MNNPAGQVSKFSASGPVARQMMADLAEMATIKAEHGAMRHALRAWSDFVACMQKAKAGEPLTDLELATYQAAVLLSLEAMSDFGEIP